VYRGYDSLFSYLRHPGPTLAISSPRPSLSGRQLYRGDDLKNRELSRLDVKILHGARGRVDERSIQRVEAGRGTGTARVSLNWWKTATTIQYTDNFLPGVRTLA